MSNYFHETDNYRFTQSRSDYGIIMDKKACRVTILEPVDCDAFVALMSDFPDRFEAEIALCLTTFNRETK